MGCLPQRWGAGGFSCVPAPFPTHSLACKPVLLRSGSCFCPGPSLRSTQLPRVSHARLQWGKEGFPDAESWANPANLSLGVSEALLLLFPVEASLSLFFVVGLGRENIPRPFLRSAGLRGCPGMGGMIALLSGVQGFCSWAEKGNGELASISQEPWMTSYKPVSLGVGWGALSRPLPHRQTLVGQSLLGSANFPASPASC